MARLKSRVCAGILIFLLALVAAATKAEPAGKEAALSRLALYQGKDREKILLEGSKKEGELTFYTSNTWMVRVAEEFGKKYPFIKVSSWRSDSKKQLKRIEEEYASGRFLVDVIEASPEMIALLHRDGLLHSALPVKAPHPHAALLFLDYLHSKEGQQLGMKGGFSSPREDVGSLEQKFKKVYLENKYSVEELEKKLNDWEILMRQLFMRKR